MRVAHPVQRGRRRSSLVDRGELLHGRLPSQIAEASRFAELHNRLSNVLLALVDVRTEFLVHKPEDLGIVPLAS